MKWIVPFIVVLVVAVAAQAEKAGSKAAQQPSTGGIAECKDTCNRKHKNDKCVAQTCAVDCESEERADKLGRMAYEAGAEADTKKLSKIFCTDNFDKLFEEHYKQIEKYPKKGRAFEEFFEKDPSFKEFINRAKIFLHRTGIGVVPKCSNVETKEDAEKELQKKFDICKENCKGLAKAAAIKSKTKDKCDDEMCDAKCAGEERVGGVVIKKFGEAFAEH